MRGKEQRRVFSVSVYFKQETEKKEQARVGNCVSLTSGGLNSG